MVAPVTECDLLVAGSGAGGMAAALAARHRGLDVVVAEKDRLFGGTTARSGGWLWVPGNPVAARAGVTDDVAAARDYLRHEAGNHFDADRVGALLAEGPRMVAFMEQETALRFMASPAFPDYHPDAPGGGFGRSICTLPFDGRTLGTDIRRLRRPMREMTFLGMAVSSGSELKHFLKAGRSLPSALFVAWRLIRQARDTVVHGRGMRLTNGNALAGRLMKSAQDAGIPLWLETPVRELIVEDGAVRGAVVRRAGADVTVSTRRGVVLATGGFGWDAARRRDLFAFPPEAESWPLSPPGNAGDGLRLGEAAGGAIDADLAQPAAWFPVSRVPWPDGETGTYAHIIDRAKPGVIAVLRDGRRFVNEANSYHDFVQAMMAGCRGAARPEAFLICDHRTLRRYGLGFVKPFPMPLAPHLKNGYLIAGETPESLARAAGIDAAGLAATLAAFNPPAHNGDDPEFAKGSTAYNRFQGDAEAHPSPCVAPVERPPFYAVRVVPGDLSTYAGLATDAKARVVDGQGRPVPGLYAAGSDMASALGGSYPGAGTCIGPAMTFGFIAGNHAADG